MKLKDRIRKIRETYNLTQADIADKMNCSASTYGQFERNAENASFITLKKVSEAIGVTLPFLIDIKRSDYIE